MNYTENGTDARPVHLDIDGAALQGALRINPQVRTLDDLNVVSRSFVMLHEPRLVAGASSLIASASLAVNKNAVRFVYELAPPPPRPNNGFAERFTRAPIRVRVGPYEIEGFVHLPPGGDPLKRLIQDNHPFLSLTDALVSGAGTETATPFVAVNRHHVTLAQKLAVGQPAVAASLTLTD